MLEAEETISKYKPSLKLNKSIGIVKVYTITSGSVFAKGITDTKVGAKIVAKVKAFYAIVSKTYKFPFTKLHAPYPLTISPWISDTYPDKILN